MYDLLYRIEVEKDFAYGVKTVIDFIWGVSCTNNGNGRLIVNLDIPSRREVYRVKDTISHLPHVLKVQIH